MTLAVECKDLQKHYGPTNALENIDLRLEPDKIYGLLGRNGAGKTTLLHILTGQMVQSGGDARIFGANPFENAQTLSKTCLVKESQQYIKSAKINDIFELASLFYPRWDDAYAQQLIREFDLDTKKKMKHLSRGMESMVGIIIGLASRAEITIFDEPYLGLDAAGRSLFYDHIVQDYAQNPRTIILSTHLIDEVDPLFEEVVLLDRGRIVLHEKTDDLRTRAFVFSGREETIRSVVDEDGILHTKRLGDKAVLSYHGSVSEAALNELRNHGVTIDSLPLQKWMIDMTSKEVHST